MDAEARNQYLRELREEYCLARKALKSQLLDEAVKRTGLARKVIIRKLARPVTLVRRPRAKRRRIYDAAVAAALTELWTLFDYPCGQRLVPLLREQVPRLRQQGWWHCSEEVAAKLLRISAKTADRLLAPPAASTAPGPAPRQFHAPSAVGADPAEGGRGMGPPPSG
jgi:hypothetical protein